MNCSIISYQDNLGTKRDTNQKQKWSLYQKTVPSGKEHDVHVDTDDVHDVHDDDDASLLWKQTHQKAIYCFALKPTNFYEISDLCNVIITNSFLIFET